MHCHLVEIERSGGPLVSFHLEVPTCASSKYYLRFMFCLVLLNEVAISPGVVVSTGKAVVVIAVAVPVVVVKWKCS